MDHKNVTHDQVSRTWGEEHQPTAAIFPTLWEDSPEKSI